MDARPNSTARWLVLVEIALVFVVFGLEGGWPVPDVNEPYYLGKAIHYWNPDWISNDPFLGTADTHKVFYFACGWMSLFLSPTLLAWTLRFTTWWLMAWSWRRLSMAIAPVRWMSVLTAAVFVCLLTRCHLAGEWVVGGVEAKGFAYVLVFLGLEAIARDRWNRVWLLFGAAGAFHVLVGGWSVIAGGVAWLLLGNDRPKVTTMLGGLIGGFLLSLPGLVPCVLLSQGTPSEVVDLANQIHVFERIRHHLDPSAFPDVFVQRFVLLTVLWVLVSWTLPVPTALRCVRGYVVGALMLAVAGTAISLVTRDNPALAAGLLRFYWFRLADVAVPLGVALAAPGILSMGRNAVLAEPNQFNIFSRSLRSRPVTTVVLGLLAVGLVAVGYWICTRYVMRGEIGIGLVVVGTWLISWGCCRVRGPEDVPHHARRVYALALVLFLLVPAAHLGQCVVRICSPTVPRADSKIHYYASWRDACRWTADPANVEPDARFLTPRNAHTFKWYTSRSEVGNWKDVPQDAAPVVAWHEAMKDIHASGSRDPLDFWHRTLARSLAHMSIDRIARLADDYDADYVVTLQQPHLHLDVVYENQRYVIYRLPGREKEE